MTMVIIEFDFIVESGTEYYELRRSISKSRLVWRMMEDLREHEREAAARGPSM